MILLPKHLLAAAGLAGALGFAGMEIAAPDAQDPAGPRRLVHYDIAMDGSSFSFQGATTPSGVPAKGTPFIIQGYIYPAGTFAQYGALSGVEPNGDPSFPAMVLGTWTCRGWHLLDGDATTGAVVATTQTFDFDLGAPGATTITTDGIELADFDAWFKRTICGGTGEFTGLQGQTRQMYVGGGTNVSGGFNTTVEFDLYGKKGM